MQIRKEGQGAGKQNGWYSDREGRTSVFCIDREAVEEEKEKTIRGHDFVPAFYKKVSCFDGNDLI